MSADKALGTYEISECSGQRSFDRVYFGIDAADTLSNYTWLWFGLALLLLLGNLV